jgi:hypothetical protein
VDDLLRHLQTPGGLLRGEACFLLRRLQPYLINVRRCPLARYQKSHLVQELRWDYGSGMEIIIR